MLRGICKWIYYEHMQLAMLPGMVEMKGGKSSPNAISVNPDNHTYVNTYVNTCIDFPYYKFRRDFDVLLQLKYLSDWHSILFSDEVVVHVNTIPRYCYAN